MSLCAQFLARGVNKTDIFDAYGNTQLLAILCHA